MRQTLFYIPNQVAGLPFLQNGSGYGFGLALAFVLLVGGVVLWNKYRRQGTAGDFYGTAGVLTLISLAIIFVVPKLANEQGLAIRGYGTMLLIAVVSGVGLAMWRAKQMGANPEIILAMMFPIFIGGLVGARTLFVVDHWEQYRPPDGSWASIKTMLWEILNVTTGGLVVYGSLLGATIPFVWFMRRYRLPLLSVCDIVVASLLLGQGLGRLGCLLNGCCFGSICESPRLPRIEFPFGSPAHHQQVEIQKLFIHGLKLESITLGKERRTVVMEVEPGSLAERNDVQPDQRIEAIVVSSADDVQSVSDALKALPEIRAELNNWKTVLQPNVETALGALFAANGSQRHNAVTLRLAGDATSRVATWQIDAAALPHSLPVQPTQLYDAINAGIMALFAWLYFPFRRRDGEVFALMLTIFPISRFLMEWVRTDEPTKYGFGPIAMTISQSISVGLFLSSFAFWWWVLRQKPEERLTPDDWAPHNARWAEAVA